MKCFIESLHNKNNTETNVMHTLTAKLTDFVEGRVHTQNPLYFFENMCHILRFYCLGLKYFVKYFTFELNFYPDPDKSHEMEILVTLFQNYYAL